MATVNLSARDIDLIGRVVDTEVPRSIAKRNPQEYQRMVGAVVDTITNRLASNRYGATVESVLNQRRAFSKITGPKRLDPYGSVAKAPPATYTAQTAVNDHIKGRIAGLPSIVGGALDYANPHFSDRKNLRGWVQPMIDAGAKMLGIGNAVHYHGVAPGNFPAPPTDIHGPPGFSHRGPPGPIDPSSPMRPDEANAAGPKGNFSVTPSYAAPLGVVERGPGLGPASLPPDRQMPTAPVEGSLPASPARPDNMNYAGPKGLFSVPSNVPDSPTLVDALPSVAPTLAPTISPVPGMPSLPSMASQEVVSPGPDAPASPTVSPTVEGAFPTAPEPPSTWDKVKYTGKPIARDAMLGLKLGGPLGALGVAGVGMLGRELGIGNRPGFDNAAPDRFSTGFGLSGITSAMGGPKGAQGFSLSNPGMSFTSLGNGLGLRRSDKFGWTEVVGPSGEVRGIKYDNPKDKGLLGKLSKSMNDKFGGGISDAERASFSGRVGLY